MALITVRFYGRLKPFGDRFQLEVRDTAEAVRALMTQLPNLRQQLQQGFYKVRIGKHYLNPEALEQGLFYCLKDGMTVHFTPVIKGAKKAGVFQAVLGVALIGAAFALGPMGFALMGKSTAMMMGIMGGSMLLGGVSQMLTKMPAMSNGGNNAEKKSSTAFSSIQNRAAQGQPVPLAYGRIRCGSMIISQGVETYDAESEKTKPKKKTGFSKG